MSAEPYLSRDENRVAPSGSCGCSLLGAQLAGCVMVHGMAGGTIEAVHARCQLLPLLMLRLSVLLVSISLSLTPVMTVSGVTDGGSNQDGFLPHQNTAQREKVRKLVGSAISPNAVAQRCFCLH